MSCDRDTYLSEGHALESPSATDGMVAEQCSKCGYWHLKREKKTEQAGGEKA